MQNSGIYKIVNTKNQRVYIGSTRRLDERGKEHFRDLRKNDHDNPYLQHDFNKCGEQNFVYEIICHTLKEEDLLIEEQEFLNACFDDCNQCYNISPYAHRPPSCLGVPKTPEQKKKISESKRNPSDETRKRLSEAQKGKPSTFKGKVHSEESRRKMAEAQSGEKNHFFGKRHSEETKQRMSKSSANRRAVIAIELANDKKELVFESLNQTALYYGVERTSISAVLSGRCLTCKNGTLSFRYADSE